MDATQVWSSVCAEPDGNVEPEHNAGRTAHQILLAMTGQCPWCGEEVTER
jgi:hypothetical protein